MGDAAPVNRDGALALFVPRYSALRVQTEACQPHSNKQITKPSARYIKAANVSRVNQRGFPANHYHLTTESSKVH